MNAATDAALSPGRTVSEAPTFGAATTGKVGMWIFLVTDAMTFGGLLLAYGILRVGNTQWPTPTSVLGIPFTAVMTFVLIVSSLTMVLALDAAKKGQRLGAVKWLLATAGGGIFFLCGQAYEYTHLIRHGFTLPSGNFPATFYVITSFHGGHVFTGVCYLLVTAAGVFRGKHLENGANFVEITGLFWHFVDLIWILVFTLVYLIP
ncbi:MAG: cytochrome c oxidase subunit 3 [Thermoanaerobaculia bacterium]|jgi:heme/copper-type cytochrome/quinol oxidase subunit 3